MYSSFHTSHYNQNDHSDSSLDPLDPELYADDFGEQRGGVNSSYSSSATSTSSSSSSSSSFSKKRPKKNGHSSDSSSSSAPQVRDRRASTELIERYAYATSSSRSPSSMSSSSLSAAKSSHSSTCSTGSTPRNRQNLTFTPTFKRTLALVFGNVCLLFAMSSMSVVSPNGLIYAIGTFISNVRYHTHRALCSTDEMALISSSFRRALISVTGIFIGYTQAGQDDPDIAMLLNCDSFWLPYIPVPDHLQVVCPERQDSPCPEGSFVKNDCSCTTPDEDPCGACPHGTRCQKKMMNLPLMCIDCTCSFCNVEEEPCCSFDGKLQSSWISSFTILEIDFLGFKCARTCGTRFISLFMSIAFICCVLSCTCTM